jgi:hypothetical protein
VAYLLLTCQLSTAEATIEDAARSLDVDPDAIDREFGVVLIDPADGRYAVMVDERAVERALSRDGVEGPFANPKIEPFGPPTQADEGGRETN